MPETMDKALSCTVASLVPWEIFEEKPGLYPGKFRIPKSDTKTPQLIYISNLTIHHVYLDDTRGHLIARDPSNEVAASIVRDYNNAQIGIAPDARPGLFWVPGYQELAQIDKKLIEENQKVQRSWFLNLCKMADDDWTRYHKHAVISDFQRSVAPFVGWKPEDHEWMRAEIAEEKVEARCVACNSPITHKTVVCPMCKCILKPEEHKKLTFA